MKHGVSSRVCWRERHRPADGNQHAIEQSRSHRPVDAALDLSREETEKRIREMKTH